MSEPKPTPARGAPAPTDTETEPKRQRLALSDLGLAIDHRRVEDMGGLPLPAWQAAAIAGTPEEA